MTTLAPKAPNGTALIEPFEDPFTAFAALRRAMTRSFLEPLATGFEATIVPAVDLYEKDGSYVLECALPGYTKDNVKVEATGDTVTITGSYKQEQKEEKARYHRRELRRGSFARSVVLPQEIDSEKVEATFANGMLTLTLPLSKAVAGKQIPIGG